MRTVLVLLSLAAAAFAGGIPRWITLDEARTIALQKHPKITVAELNALAAKRVVAETVAPMLPQVTVTLGGAAAGEQDARIVTSPLPVSAVSQRAGGYVLVSQLITDFGRTWHLRNSAKLKAGAEEQNVEATRAQILLQVDGAYYGALQAKALLLVAEGTVQTRKYLRDQIATLAHNELKSDLDVGFAETNYQESVLLLSKAQNDMQSAAATLAALLDEPRVSGYRLASTPAPTPLPHDLEALISQSLRSRPDLQRLRLESRSASELAKAETALSFPTVSAQGTAGLMPWHQDTFNESYAAAGFVVSIPFFTGGYNFARQKEAALRAEAAGGRVHDEENNAIRDVRLAWLGCKDALERVSITDKLFEQATKTLALARARYDAGSSSIVELSQSQLNVTAAEIAHTNARYEYLVRRSLLDYQIGSKKQ